MSLQADWFDRVKKGMFEGDETAPSNEPQLFGKIAVELGLLTQEQIDACLKDQEDALAQGTPNTLGQG